MKWQTIPDSRCSTLVITIIMLDEGLNVFVFPMLINRAPLWTTFCSSERQRLTNLSWKEVDAAGIWRVEKVIGNVLEGLQDLLETRLRREQSRRQLVFNWKIQKLIKTQSLISNSVLFLLNKVNNPLPTRGIKDEVIYGWSPGVWILNTCVRKSHKVVTTMVIGPLDDRTAEISLEYWTIHVCFTNWPVDCWRQNSFLVAAAIISLPGSVGTSVTLRIQMDSGCFRICGWSCMKHEVVS